MPAHPFHLAVEVSDLARSREFYGGLLGCAEGRSADSWVDFNFFGHQLVCHMPLSGVRPSSRATNPVDGNDVPVPHFGVVLDMDEWQSLARRLERHNIQFLIRPQVRFKGKAGEQVTMFLLDPSGNALEFKAFRDVAAQLFEK